MDAKFNSLERNKRYIFWVGHGGAEITGVFHEIHPDGLLRVVTKYNYTYYINPDQILQARRDD